MKLWQNKPNMYTRIGFIDIPEGDHRAKVCRVEAQKASKGRVCYEITLQVSYGTAFGMNPIFNGVEKVIWIAICSSIPLG